MKKSKIVESALSNFLARTPEQTRNCGKHRYLCIAVMNAANHSESKYGPICDDITELLAGKHTVESFLRKDSKFPSFEEALEFRINLANNLINRYKEEECKPISTVLSKVYNKMKGWFK